MVKEVFKATMMRRVIVPEMPSVWFRRILSGISAYAATTPDWDVMLLGSGDHNVRSICEARPDGVIATIFATEQLGPWEQQLHCPIVNVAGIRGDGIIPSVCIDDAAIGKMAAEYLLEQGLKHFAFAGIRNHAGAEARMWGFHAALGQCETFNAHFADTNPVLGSLEQTRRIDQDLIEWLDRLPKPVGIFAWNDEMGMYVVQTCRRIEINVPDEVAVLGVDDDDVWCGLCNPPLSSIALPVMELGYQAARLLDEQMRGSVPQRDGRRILLPPRGIQTRRSTDVLAIDDPLIVEAVSFIRENLHQRVNVNDVVAAMAVSRRALETRFQQTIKRSPQQEIHRQQLAVVEQLLRTTEMPLKTIAQRAGYRDPNHLIRVFIGARGTSPSRFRERLKEGELRRV